MRVRVTLQVFKKTRLRVGARGCEAEVGRRHVPEAWLAVVLGLGVGCWALGVGDGVKVGVRARVRGALETFRLERAEPIQELPLLRLLRNKRGGSLAIAAARAAIRPSAAVAAVAADGVGEREELLAQRLVRVRVRLRVRVTVRVRVRIRVRVRVRVRARARARVRVRVRVTG